MISECVASVSQRILPQLIAANDQIQQLNFMFGHPTEIKMEMKAMSEDPTLRYQKFPVIMLFSDVINSPTTVRGCFNDVTLNMVIAMNTEPQYLAAQCVTENFIPILRPIYQEFIQEIYRCGYFWIQSPLHILGRDIERFYWGKSDMDGNTANKGYDFIDAIEIKNLKLTVSRPGTALVQNTFTQMIQYFLSQTRATITVGAVIANTITNNFFLQPVTEITAGMQDYIEGVDFTQDTTAGTITGISVNFFPNQVIIAKR